MSMSSFRQRLIGFADGARTRSPLLFRIGQAAVWALRAVRRHIYAVVGLLALSAALAFAPLLHPGLWSLRGVLWVLSALGVLTLAGGILSAIFAEMLRRTSATHDASLKGLKHELTEIRGKAERATQTASDGLAAATELGARLGGGGAFEELQQVVSKHGTSLDVMSATLSDVVGFVKELRSARAAEQKAAEQKKQTQMNESAFKLQEINIHEISFEVPVGDARWLPQRKLCEEKSSLLYKLIREERFQNFIDIGANCGLVSTFMRLTAPNIRILAVEADDRLIGLIRSNFERNRLVAPTIVHAIASEETGADGTFSLNPNSTLDNRVTMPNWQQRSYPQTRISDLLETQGISGRTFFKIDTQGHEEKVLRGMEPTLSRSDDWFIKMEFGPQWLESQGTDPLQFLQSLCSKYIVAESPERIPFNTKSLAELLRSAISVDQTDGFLSYVIALNERRRGWVDLLVAPRTWRS